MGSKIKENKFSQEMETTIFNEIDSKGVNITNFQTMILVSKSTEITIGGGVILHEKKNL